ncbi:manganese efflux pump [Paenibacillus pini]|uniref:Integral membrane protein n=1 Tax=Paenibacillus pini JCM 16418 TaxID=1236976 RepID=W7YNT9_9BACL|nr:manganese efflux pump [Paenibacillus pini]GAF06341.1 integral membrane protein [Paenibacillus pini JCM 16418]
MLSHVVTLLLLAFALSLDSFGVGITYGLRQMKITPLSVIIISLCSGVIIYLSMQVGVLLAKVVAPNAASAVGAIILIIMGSWSLIQLRLQKEKGEEDGLTEKCNDDQEEHDQAYDLEKHEHANDADSDPNVGPEQMDGAASIALHLAPTEMITAPEQTVFSFEIRKLGLVIRILRTPSSADVDQSGSITGLEAMWLGIALSLDAFGAGLGLALLGFSPLWTAMVIALFSGSFLVMGMKLGFRFASKTWMRHFTAMPAILLIMMGIIKLL